MVLGLKRKATLKETLDEAYPGLFDFAKSSKKKKDPMSFLFG